MTSKTYSCKNHLSFSTNQNMCNTIDLINLNDTGINFNPILIIPQKSRKV